METSTQILRISMSPWITKQANHASISGNVFVDLGKRTVTGISEEPERIMKKTLQHKSHLYWNEYVYAGYS